MNLLSIPPDPEESRQFDFFVLRDSLRELQDKFSKSELASRFSDEQIELIYSIGHSFFMQGKFEQALNIFKLIILYRPIDARNMEAYATTLKRMGRFDEAIPVYVAAMVFGELSLPMPVIHIAECLAAIGRSAESERLLRPMLDMAKVDEAYAEVRGRAETLLDMLRKGQ
jgi:tetratricopeptide (TPR) repeat protein